MAELSTLGTVIHEAQAPLDSWKGTARAATDSIIVRSGLITVDGVLLVAGDVVLDQHAAVSADRGLYIASAGAWSRASSAPEGGNLDGAVVRVMEGTINGDKTFAQNASPCVVGTDAQTWLEQAGGGGAVDSVFTRTGAVVAAAGDYDASLISNDSSVSGTSVKDALETLASSSGLQFTTTLYAVPFVPEVGKINRYDGSVVGLVVTFPPGADGDVLAFTAEGGLGGDATLTPDTVAPEYILITGFPALTLLPFTGGLDVFRFNAATSTWLAETAVETILKSTIAPNTFIGSGSAGVAPVAVGEKNFVGRRGSADLGTLSPSQAREMLALCQQTLANGAAVSFDAEEGGSNAVLELAQAGHSFDFIPAASGPGGKIIITNPNALFSITTWTVSGGTVKHTGGTPPAFGVGRYVLGWYWDGTDVDVWIDSSLSA